MNETINGLFEQLFHTSSDAILLFEEGAIIDCNDATVKMLGYQSKESVLGKTPDQISPELQPDGRSSKEVANEHIKLTFEKGEHHYQFMHQRANGQDFLSDMSLRLLKYGQREIFQVGWRDVSDKKRLLDSLDQNVIFSKTDLNGTITQVSSAFCKISGYSHDELIGSSHNIVRHPDMPASTFRHIWDVIRQQNSITVELKNKNKNGTFYWVESKFEPQYNLNGHHVGYSAIRFDITHRKEAESLQNEIEETQKEVVFRMGAIAETRSKETGNHVKRVAEYSKIFALHIGLDKQEAELIKQASPMHDIGKVGIPDSILNKPGKLDAQEWEIMQTHAQIGYDMLSGSTKDLLKMAAIVAHEHHEKYDGSGYPRGLKGDEIHIYGRITAIADVFDALGSERCYKKAWGDNEIFSLFRSESAKHFDPKLVDIFFNHIDDFLAIRDKLRDIAD